MPKPLFKPGDRANPRGRPKGSGIPEHVRKLKNLNLGEFQAAVARICAMTMAEINAFRESGNATGMDLLVLGQLQAAIKGKTMASNFLLDRTVGKAVDYLEIKDTTDPGRNEIETLKKQIKDPRVRVAIERLDDELAKALADAAQG